MKKTKIICSIGPKTEDWDNFKKLINAGMNVARINFSHATEEQIKKIKENQERAKIELKKHIALLYDTKGPDLRTCSFEDGEIKLVKGKTIRIVEDEIIGTEEKICFNYRNVVKKLEIGTKFTIDDGFYNLEVISKEDDGVTCKIGNTGIIKSRRGVCIPGIDLDVPYISEEDKEDIKYACENDGDFLAISFVNSKKDILEVRELCKKYGKKDMPIISKVETKYAVENIEEIVEESDYVMVARGDLGTEVGLENLPLYQELIIKTCHKYSKGVIMATQMMYSMRDNIRPTNAEVNDVANAILSGCDAIMTSEETTIGNYPIETVKTMTQICESTEKMTKYNLEEYVLRGSNIHNAITKRAVEVTKELPIKAIVAETATGKTAIDISSLRPNAYILAIVDDEKVCRSLLLRWGIYTSLINPFNDEDDIVKKGIQESKKILELKKGDLVEIIGSIPTDAHTNFLKIEEI